MIGPGVGRDLSAANQNPALDHPSQKILFHLVVGLQPPQRDKAFRGRSLEPEREGQAPAPLGFLPTPPPSLSQPAPCLPWLDAHPFEFDAD